MDQEKRERLAQRLDSRLGFRRRSAVKQLAAAPSEETVPLLVKAVEGADAKASTLAEAALRALPTGGAVDALCAAWEAARSPRLAALVKACQYIASGPPLLRAQTALLNGRRPGIESPEEVDAVTQALDDPDGAIAKNAAAALAAIRDRTLIDLLIERANAAPTGRLARACAAARFRHTADRENSAFLVLTGQADAFFEDFRGKETEGLRLLRQAYEHGNEGMRAELMRIVRAGDRRFASFFDLGKARHEMAEDDILTDMGLRLRDKDWPALFELLREVPMKFGYPLLEHFRRSGWEPEDPERRALYHRLLEHSKGHAVRPAGGAADPGTAQSGLAAFLDKAEPLEGMGLVVVLARGGANDEIRRKVATHPLWGVRMVGRLSGLCPDSLFKADDPVLQVKDLRPLDSSVSLGIAIPALELWPSRATLGDLKAITDMPKKAFQGRLGAVRKVLRDIIAADTHMVQGGEVMSQAHAGAVTGGEEPDAGFEDE